MKTAEEMASDEFLAILNQDTVLFEKDIEPMVNNGAPVLKGLVYVVTDSARSVSGLGASVSEGLYCLYMIILYRLEGNKKSRGYLLFWCLWVTHFLNSTMWAWML
jgi:hypothetical protein